MSHHKVKPGHKHDLFDEPWRPGATGPHGTPYARKVYSKLIPSIDVSISRENPHRKIPKSNVLVAGFDAEGTFDFVVPEGNTHGYWTLTKQLQNSTGLSGPEDHGGSGGDYVARTLIEYDLGVAGIASGDEIEAAHLELTVFKSKTMDGKYTFDFYRLHAGTTHSSFQSYPGTAATAVDAIDTTGYVASGADASFTISIPTSAGGLGGTTITILLDESVITPPSGSANTIKIGTYAGAETDALAAGYIIDAINGVTDARIVYATSGNGEAADDLGITAKQGSSNTQITLTMDTNGNSGNISSALASVSGLNIIDVTAFTGGFNANINALTENATWYEYDHSGTGLSGVTSGEVVGRSFLTTDGMTHGNRRWDSQGCGITGSTAEHLAVTAGETAALAWLDKSGGSTTANHDALVGNGRDDHLYNYTLPLEKSQVLTNSKIRVDITGAVKDAVNNYVNKLRMVIQLRNDDLYNGTDSRGFICFYSSNFAKGDSELSQSKGSPAPTLSITWYDKST